MDAAWGRWYPSEGKAPADNPLTKRNDLSMSLPGKTVIALGSSFKPSTLSVDIAVESLVVVSRFVFLSSQENYPSQLQIDLNASRFGYV
jgi:hypothetical protein